MSSPKGNYRLKGIFVTGLVFLVLVALSGGFDNYGNWYLEKALNPNGWIFKQLNNIAEACIGLFLLYAGHRTINHKRTHELLDKDNKWHDLTITGVWIIAIAYIVGNAVR